MVVQVKDRNSKQVLFLIDFFFFWNFLLLQTYSNQLKTYKQA